MAHLFRELSCCNSPSPTLSKSASSLASVIPPSADPLPSPLGRIVSLSDHDLRKHAKTSTASQIESVMVPLELLHQLKSSDYTDHQEYEAWQKRSLKVLEAGLLLHPRVPLSKLNITPQRLRHIIQGALERPIETGRNNELMQILRSTVRSLAARSNDGSPDSCHWADEFPLNIWL